MPGRVLIELEGSKWVGDVMLDSWQVLSAGEGQKPELSAILAT